MKFIKNNTVWDGKIFLKFEKYPWYSNGTRLNKVHLDLGFTKLVSRIVQEGVDLKKIELIEEHTGGKIGKYETEYINLANSFLSIDGTYIGDASIGWWYYKNKFKVCNLYPLGVAEVHEDGKIIGYHGYSHRGGQTFKVGDRLFDDTYSPVPEDYSQKQWSKFEKDYKEYLERNDGCFEPKFTDIVPFRLRGKTVIETLEQAKQAAINLSNHLS